MQSADQNQIEMMNIVTGIRGLFKIFLCEKCGSNVGESSSQLKWRKIKFSHLRWEIVFSEHKLQSKQYVGEIYVL